jgi:LacI family gluconate utilization system Gnt-I transcriptional repressor
MVALPINSLAMTDKTLNRKRRGSGAVTLNDVAKIAGVAPITASRALNHPAQVSADVLRKVKAAVARTGYVPNRMAGGLASAKSGMIAAIVPSAVNSVFMETIESLNGSLFDAGYQLMLGQSGYSAAREEMLIESFIGRRPDGIFLAGLLKPGKARTMLIASGIPVLETWDLTTTPIDMLIGFSHSEVGRTVAGYLLKKKCSKFAVVTADDERATRRCTAFCDALKVAGIKDVLVVNIGSNRTLREGRLALANILKSKPDTQAVFCSSDLLALGVLTEAQVRGIRIPEQLSVIGFGDATYVGDMVPSLTSVRVNSSKIGSLAAHYFIQRAEGAEINPLIVDIGFSIVERDTA